MICRSPAKGPTRRIEAAGAYCFVIVIVTDVVLDFVGPTPMTRDTASVNFRVCPNENRPTSTGSCGDAVASDAAKLASEEQTDVGS